MVVLDGLGAFFDASGTDPQQRVWAVGGWLGKADEWELLDDRWEKMIDAAPWRESIPHDKRIYHATDLESRLGIYHGWSKDEKREFQNQAYGIIEQLPSLVPVSSSLIKKDWSDARINLKTVEYGHAGNYFVSTVFDVLRVIGNWADSNNYDGPIHYFFEAGDLGEGNVDAALHELLNDPKRRAKCRMATYTFAHKQLRPLQSADLWAYEAYKQMLNQIVDGSVRDPRYPASRLWKECYKRFNVYFDRARLDDLIELGRKMLKDKD